MCETLAGLKEATSLLVGRFDPALVAQPELRQALLDAGAIEKMMAALTSLIATRLATVGKDHHAARQAARDLARASGTSLGDATRAIDVGKQLQAQPDVDAAARAGRLSRQQAALVAGAVAVNPEASGRLLELAATGSLGELAEESARARAVNQDLEARRQAAHGARSLRHYTDPFGTWNLVAHGTPEDGAKVMAAINTFADQAFERARADGRRERPEAYAFDGLVGLATSGGAQPPRADIIVRVDLAVMVRGYPLDGETCEIVGFGPISAQAVRDIMESDDPFLKAVVTKGKEVVSVIHFGRRPNAYQKTALDWLFPCCAAEGCGTRAEFLQTDHRVDWAKTHVTVLDFLDRLCRFHHGLKTNSGWALVHGRGKRAFVPPDDPRHPRRTRTDSGP